MYCLHFCAPGCTAWHAPLYTSLQLSVPLCLRLSYCTSFASLHFSAPFCTCLFLCTPLYMYQYLSVPPVYSSPHLSVYGVHAWHLCTRPWIPLSFPVFFPLYFITVSSSLFSSFLSALFLCTLSYGALAGTYAQCACLVLHCEMMLFSFLYVRSPTHRSCGLQSSAGLWTRLF